MISDGKFKHTKTECHIRFENILKKLEIKYEDEFVVEYWSFDFYLPEYNFYIEIDGDYWHSNPKFYPDGPKTKAQKINYTRNISKNNFCIKNNLNLLRFWENQIINNEKDIICNLKKLLE
jgi:very-short-patch-repair endonuclease